jgi:hypothetical protein
VVTSVVGIVANDEEILFLEYGASGCGEEAAAEAGQEG